MSKRVHKIRRQSQRIHFSRRSEERLGYILNVETVIKIREAIRSETAELLHVKRGVRLSVWRVSVKSGTIIVVYSHETEELVTLLTEEMWKERTRWQ